MEFIFVFIEIFLEFVMIDICCGVIVGFVLFLDIFYRGIWVYFYKGIKIIKKKLIYVGYDYIFYVGD